MAIKKNTLCVIIGHGKEQATFDRHLPLWERHGLPILVCCPTDDQITTDHEKFLSGESSFNGPKAVVRWRNILGKIVSSGYKQVVMFEYDSIYLGKEIAFSAGLHGILQVNTEPARFYTHRFVNAPWTLDSASAFAMLKVSKQYTGVTEGGSDDRLLSAWALLSGVPILPHPEPAFADNTIRSYHFPFLDVALRGGLRWIHGVKTPEVLNFITSWK